MLTIIIAVIIALLLFPLVGPIIIGLGSIIVFILVVGAILLGLYFIFSSDFGAMIVVLGLLGIAILIFGSIFNYFIKFFSKPADPNKKSFLFEKLVPFFLTERKKFQYFDKIEQIRLEKIKKIENKKLEKKNKYEAQIAKERKIDKQKKEKFVLQIKEKLIEFYNLKNLIVENIEDNNNISEKVFKVGELKIFDLTYRFNENKFSFRFDTNGKKEIIIINTPLYGEFSIKKIIPNVVKRLKNIK